MERIVEIALLNAASAAALALFVATIGCLVRRPALMHVLWLVVLLDLLAPPVLHVGVLPGTQPPVGVSVVRPAVVPAAAFSLEPPVANRLAPPPTGESVPPARAERSVTIARIAVGAWLAGALLLLLVAALRVGRFRRLVTRAEVANTGLRGEMARIAARMGLAEVPGLRLVDAPISPMLWTRLGKPEVLFPAALLNRLSRAERETLIAHELAHAVRRDHWVRYVELVTGCLFWWHPIVWWARSRLRRAEERCCDALVLRTLPHRSGEYARGLLKTVEFLSASPTRVLATASGAAEAHDLKERLTMIVKRRSHPSLSRTQALLLALGAAGLLLVFPTWAERAPEPAAAPEPGAEPAPRPEAETEAMLRQRLLELEKSAVVLEAELHELRARQREIEMEYQLNREAVEVDRLHRAAAEEAAAVRAEREFHAQRRAADLERARLHLERAERVESLELPLRRLHIEIEAAREAGDTDRVEALSQRARDVQVELEDLALDEQIRREVLEQRRMDASLERMVVELEHLKRAGRHAEADEIARSRDRAGHENEMRRFYSELEALVDTLRAEGRVEELEELTRRIDELKSGAAEPQATSPMIR